jgi:hypothetical protein
MIKVLRFYLTHELNNFPKVMGHNMMLARSVDDRWGRIHGNSRE